MWKHESVRSGSDSPRRQLGLSDTEKLAHIIDVLGERILGIKEQFDVMASANSQAGKGDEMLTKEQTIGLCLDLGMKGPSLAALVIQLESTLSHEEDAHKDACVSFSTFLMLYGQHLLNEPVEAASATSMIPISNKSAVVTRADSTTGDDPGSLRR